jgi:uncharacterized protein YbjT (DUF2867 family)
MFRLLASLPVIPLIGDGGQVLQPIRIDDFALAVARLTERNEPQRGIVELAGPRAVTCREFLLGLRTAMGRGPAPCVEVPMPLMHLAARLADTIHFSPLAIDHLDMLARGNIAADNAAAILLGRKPHEVAEFHNAPPANCTGASGLRGNAN